MTPCSHLEREQHQVSADVGQFGPARANRGRTYPKRRPASDWNKQRATTNLGARSLPRALARSVSC